MRVATGYAGEADTLGAITPNQLGVVGLYAYFTSTLIPTGISAFLRLPNNQRIRAINHLTASH